MRIKGLTLTIKDLRKIQSDIEKDLDLLEGHENKFERLNDVWLVLDGTCDNLKEIADI